jgi:hypothetical protein
MARSFVSAVAASRDQQPHLRLAAVFGLLALVLAGAASAQHRHQSEFGAPRPANLLTNPSFDKDLSGWSVPGIEAGWQAVDADGSPSSGSLRAVFPANSGGALFIKQCVAVTAGVSYDLSLKMRASDADPGVGVVVADFFASTDCSGSFLSPSIEVRQLQSPQVFATNHTPGVAPAGAQSALVWLGGSQAPDGTANTIEYDDVYFGLAAPASCTPDSQTLCLDSSPGDRRFRVQTQFVTTQGGGLSGNGNAVSTSSLGITKGGLFWFFAADNPELLVKVLNACSTSNFIWVFISAGTNVGVNVLIADTQTGAVVLFHNPDLGAFPSIQDTSGVPCVASSA